MALGLGNLFEGLKNKLIGKEKTPEKNPEKEKVRSNVLKVAQATRKEVDEDLENPRERQLAQEICEKLDAKTKIKTLKALHRFYKEKTEASFKDEVSAKTQEQVHAQIKAMASKRGMNTVLLEKAIHQQLWKEFQEEKRIVKVKEEKMEEKERASAKKNIMKNAELVVKQIESGKNGKAVETELIHLLKKEFEPDYKGKTSTEKGVSQQAQQIMYRLSMRKDLKKAVYELLVPANLLGGEVGMDGALGGEVMAGELEGIAGHLRGEVPPSKTEKVVASLPAAEKLKKAKKSLSESKRIPNTGKEPQNMAGSLSGETLQNVRVEDLSPAQKEELRKQLGGMISSLDQAEAEHQEGKLSGYLGGQSKLAKEKTASVTGESTRSWVETPLKESFVSKKMEKSFMGGKNSARSFMNKELESNKTTKPKIEREYKEGDEMNLNGIKLRIGQEFLYTTADESKEMQVKLIGYNEKFNSIILKPQNGTQFAINQENASRLKKFIRPASLDQIFSPQKVKERAEDKSKSIPSTGDSNLDNVLQQLDEKTGPFIHAVATLEKNLRNRPQEANPYQLNEYLKKYMTILGKKNPDSLGYKKVSEELVKNLKKIKDIIEAYKETKKFQNFYESINKRIEKLEKMSEEKSARLAA